MSNESVLRKGFVSLVLFLLASPSCVLAGGGPENVLLVVNPKSAASLCIANHYAQLRQIPADNTLFIPWDPKVDQTDIDSFRRQILLPILQLIQNRRLGSQIDHIVYSSDFPCNITLDADIAEFQKDPNVINALTQVRRFVESHAPPGQPLPNENEWPPLLGSVGSINGLTYLWQPVIARNFGYFQMQSNRYMRLPIGEQHDTRTVAFRGNRSYNPKSEIAPSGGQRYFLSTMLGVTAGRGNSLPEVLNYLRRSAAADGTHPKGTIYFVKNADVRSTVRDKFFPDAVRDLKKLGVAAEIIEGTVPLKKNDVQGVVMGTPDFNWKASGSTILPGAICEHFTSFGGILTAGFNAQTPLSEFLRYGAAGASGTVVEPYSLPEKFPLPFVQLHYARGCTLAEAFYQSVYAPYQLLIVGDPLCRPWADIPQVSTKGVEPGATIGGPLTLEPFATLPNGAKIDHFELFADGVRFFACKPGGTFSFDTARFADGYHELRVVAIGPPPIESQGRQIIPVRFANHGRKIEASLVGSAPWHADRPLTIAVSSPGSIGIAAMHGSRVVGRIAGEKGQIAIPANMLGAGPVRLRVIGLGNKDATTCIAADPIDVTLQ